ncbi:MAG: hypothetical protein WCQ95_14860, partial [Bacteroidota bacterium]
MCIFNFKKFKRVKAVALCKSGLGGMQQNHIIQGSVVAQAQVEIEREGVEVEREGMEIEREGVEVEREGVEIEREG